jgi:hypothetical protein
MVYGVSPNLLPTPADWPANVHLCGQWLAPSPAWMPPPALANFLAAGEAPIYIGFGSMTGFDNARLLDVLIEAMTGRPHCSIPAGAASIRRRFQTTFSPSATRRTTGCSRVPPRLSITAAPVPRTPPHARACLPS